jgi:hypothetical protein
MELVALLDEPRDLPELSRINIVPDVSRHAEDECERLDAREQCGRVLRLFCLLGDRREEGSHCFADPDDLVLQILHRLMAGELPTQELLLRS